jgi:oligoendopeptidase F
VRSTLGFDLQKPEFWVKSLQIVASRVRQYVDLADHILGKSKAL